MTTSPRSGAIVVSWKDLPRWDFKTARAAAFRLSHPSFRPLGDFIEEATELVRPSEQPDKEWPVFGVTNKDGVVFSHYQKGFDFNAPYKRIKQDWFFHNPTRANVGSLGRVPAVPPDALTSPEYQVWRIRGGLLPEYVEILIQTSFFIELIDFHRVGAVKERLFTRNLMEIPIPVLSESKQLKVISRWRQNRAEISEIQRRIEELENEIPFLIYTELGTPRPMSHSPTPKYMALKWEDLERWSFNYLVQARQGLAGFTRSKYPIESLEQHLVGTTNGYSIKPVVESTSHKMLKLSALTPAGLNDCESKFVKVSDQIAGRFTIRQNDLLICRSNAYEYVGKCVVVEEDRSDLLFPDIIIRIRLQPDVLPHYAREIIETPLGRSYFQVSSRRAVGGMWKISSDDIRNFPIPLPPPEIQERIVRLVGEKRAKIARERERILCLTSAAEKEIEEMILGTRPVPEINDQQKLSA